MWAGWHRAPWIEKRPVRAKSVVRRPWREVDWFKGQKHPVATVDRVRASLRTWLGGPLGLPAEELSTAVRYRR
jgi:hypothetical protein